MIYCFVYLRQQQVKIQIRAWSGIRVLARAADRLEPTCLLLEGHTERDRSPYETRRPVLLTFLSTLKFIDESISDVFNRKEVCLSARVGYGCREAVRLSLRTARRSVQTHRTILAREKKKKKHPTKQTDSQRLSDCDSFWKRSLARERVFEGKRVRVVYPVWRIKHELVFEEENTEQCVKLDELWINADLSCDTQKLGQ